MINKEKKQAGLILCPSSLPFTLNDFLHPDSNCSASIAGTSIDAEITAHCKVNSDKSITVMGSRKISMKEYGMVPPSFMMGTIKTGNDVTLKFDLTLNK